MNHFNDGRAGQRLGCRMLEGCLPVPGPGLLPDSVAGHMAYLFALRDECEMFRSRTGPPFTLG